jgi:hypothetical protein
MRRSSAFLIFSFVFLGLSASARAQDILVPAGTLLRCTLDEPNFSSATADIGDPVICHLSTLREFGQNVFPRGSYLGGHLEADKEPGHFVGKGYLQLVFDRIGFPTSDVPVPSKVIAAKGYKVDRHGDIIGHGHATRDVVEWLIPPLWPWKIITLPARGPRPTLKGEEQITVRLMDDIQIPRQVASAQVFDRPASYDRRRPYYRPQSLDRPLPASTRPRGIEQTQTASAPASNRSAVSYSAETTATPEIQPVASAPSPVQAQPELVPARVQAEAPTVELASAQLEDSLLAERQPEPLQAALPSAPASAPARQPLRITWLALKSGNVDAVTNYRIQGGSVTYVLSTGAKGSIDTTAVDWRKTSHLNTEPIASAAGAGSGGR